MTSGEGAEVQRMINQDLLLFRSVAPTDLPRISQLERASYPADEAASRSQLQYRQHHAALFFRCVVAMDGELLLTAASPKKGARSRSVSGGNSNASSVSGNANAGTGGESASGSGSGADASQSGDSIGDSNNSNNKANFIEKIDKENATMAINSHSLTGMGTVIGFITATRCHEFTEESMKAHDPTGPLLAIHSVVVGSEYRNRGVATKMLQNYLHVLEKMELKHGIHKVVLITKMKNIGLYLRTGFGVTGKSKIVHGKEEWYDCEMEVNIKGKLKRGGVGGGMGGDDMGVEKKTHPFWVLDSFSIANHHPTASATASSSTAVAADDDGSSSCKPMDTGMTGTGTSNISIMSTGKGTGNPAAVVMCESNFNPVLEDNVAWMKIVAREFNLSETTFIWKRNGNEYNIRFYTCDGSEVDLCGHATLAASMVVLDNVNSVSPFVIFYTKQNVVLKAKIASNNQSNIVMEFPAKGLSEFKDGSEERLIAENLIYEALFSSSASAGNKEECRAMIKYIGVDDGGDDLFFEVTPEAFASMPHPTGGKRGINFSPMLNWDGYNRGIIVCCEAPSSSSSSPSSQNLPKKIDFYSRFFGPKVGIEEDPVTGSAHCILGPYFSQKLKKNHVVGMQRSKRGGIVNCTMAHSSSVVRIAGSVEKAMSGDLHI